MFWFSWLVFWSVVSAVSTLLIRLFWREFRALLSFFRHTLAKWLSKPQWLQFLRIAGQTWRCVVAQVWPQPLHWPTDALLTATLPDWFHEHPRREIDWMIVLHSPHCQLRRYLMIFSADSDGPFPYWLQY